MAQPRNSVFVEERVRHWIQELHFAPTTERALRQLRECRHTVYNFAPMLWHSPGVIEVLVTQIQTIYPHVNSIMDINHAERVCDAILIMESFAAHNETRILFIRRCLLYYLFPFLELTRKFCFPTVMLRITSLAVSYSLARSGDQEVIAFMVQSHFIPTCSPILENGSELAKNIVLYILLKILLDDGGLQFICETYHRFCTVARMLGMSLISLTYLPSVNILNQVILCYNRLADNHLARAALSRCLPDQLLDGTFYSLLRNQACTRNILALLLAKLNLI